jgi:gluconate kinase
LVQRLFAPPDEEEIRRFMSLSIEDRLKWLEEIKEFIFTAMPEENRKIWEMLQSIKSE